MQEALCWLGGDPSQWDAIGIIGAVLVAVALGVLTFLQARATNAEARAVRTQAETADLQAGRGMSSADEEAFPNIVILAVTSREGAIKKDTMGIRNMGGGDAKDLRLRYRDQSSPNEVPLDRQVLAVRDNLLAPFDSRRGAASGFRLTYKTLFGTQFALDFEWDGNACRDANERLIVIPPS